MRTVVTGAAGFVGSHLIEALLERGDSVVAIDSFSGYYSAERKRANLRDSGEHPALTLVEGDLNKLDLVRLLDGAEVIYHLAGQPGVLASWGREFDVYLAGNVLTTTEPP